jgi:serine kinase of HPr protein (carbohydrate metabolism regulator)
MRIHASCVVLARAGEPFGAPRDSGVLILGSSGTGKSELALRLIERGAILVSDDRTELFARESRLYACAPAAIAGLLEVRGVGIVELPRAAEACVALVIQLVTAQDLERFPEPEQFNSPAELGIHPEWRPPLLRLLAEASAPAKVVAAAAAHAKALFRTQCKPD